MTEVESDVKKGRKNEKGRESGKEEKGGCTIFVWKNLSGGFQIVIKINIWGEPRWQFIHTATYKNRDCICLGGLKWGRGWRKIPQRDLCDHARADRSDQSSICHHGMRPDDHFVYSSHHRHKSRVSNERCIDSFRCQRVSESSSVVSGCGLCDDHIECSLSPRFCQKVLHCTRVASGENDFTKNKKQRGEMRRKEEKEEVKEGKSYLTWICSTAWSATFK